MEREDDIESQIRTEELLPSSALVEFSLGSMDFSDPISFSWTAFDERIASINDPTLSSFMMETPLQSPNRDCWLGTSFYDGLIGTDDPSSSKKLQSNLPQQSLLRSNARYSSESSITNAHSMQLINPLKVCVPTPNLAPSPSISSVSSGSSSFLRNSYEDEFDDDHSDNVLDFDLYQSEYEKLRRKNACLAVAAAAAANDHSYSNSSLGANMNSNLGLETPSESEEEIDVETLPPPTLSPMVPVRQQTRTVNPRSAAVRRNGGIKTILPQPPKRATANRAVKKAKNTKRTNKRRKAANGSDSDQDSSERRNQHNNMERIRRVNLKLDFESLKNLVPSTRHVKVSKVNVLKEAKNYVRELISSHSELERKKENLTRQRRVLTLEQRQIACLLQMNSIKRR